VYNNATNVTTVVWNQTENERRRNVSQTNSRIALVFLQGAVSDMSLNPIALTTFVPEEIPDNQKPTVTNVTIDFGTKVMYIQASETLDLSPLDTYVDLTDMYIANTTTDQYIPLSGATTSPEDTTRLTLLLTEAQKLKAALVSATEPYGDQVPTLFELGIGALRDIAGNLMDAMYSVPIEELPDTIPPNILTAALNYSTGVLHIHADESILAEPSTKVVTELLYIANANDSTLDHVQQTGIALRESVVRPLSGEDIRVTMTEIQRSRSILISGTEGGDNHSSFLYFSPGSVQDVFGVLINASMVPLLEYPDIVRPQVMHAVLHYDSGLLEITGTETLLTSLVNVDRLYLANSTSSNDIPLSGSVVLPPLAVHDNVTVTIALPESLRVAALLMSAQTLSTDTSTPVGDGTPVVLNVFEQGLYDPARLDVPLTFGFPVLEMPDRTGPVVTLVEFHLGLGRLTLTFDETVDFTLPTFPDKIQIRDVSATGGATGTAFHLPVNALVGQTNSTTAVMLVDEWTRVDSIRKSATTGGDGTPLVLDLEASAFRDLVNNTNLASTAVPLREIDDVIPPEPLNGTLNLDQNTTTLPTFVQTSGKDVLCNPALASCGVLSLRFSEILNISTTDAQHLSTALIQVGVLPRTGTTAFGVFTLDPLPLSLELRSLNQVTFTTLFFAMTEALRVALVRRGHRYRAHCAHCTRLIPRHCSLLSIVLHLFFLVQCEPLALTTTAALTTTTTPPRLHTSTPPHLHCLLYTLPYLSPFLCSTLKPLLCTSTSTSLFSILFQIRLTQNGQLTTGT
jgi:hypothetical protein